MLVYGKNSCEEILKQEKNMCPIYSYARSFGRYT